jgi:hypothetical protein
MEEIILALRQDGSEWANKQIEVHVKHACM